MTAFNTWMPGDQTYTYNGGASLSYKYVAAPDGAKLLAEVFNVPNAQAGVGTTFDMTDPPFDITKPPKVCYSSTSAFVLTLKDSDGWLWSAPCPSQSVIKERGWDWSQFTITAIQDASKEGIARPAKPADGKLLAFQFQGAEGVHGNGNNIAQQINIAYIAGRSPAVAQNGTIRTVTMLDRNPKQHTWKVGAVRLDAGTRRTISYLGTLPFGLMLGGPSRSRLASVPYRGPYIAGYQSGTPWIDLNNSERLSSMLDFMLESQEQFRQRNPNGLLGPFMHAFLPATWDSEQTGQVDSWVFDAPDGNPAWNGWQYRAFDAMAQTWSMASGDGARPGVTIKLQRICLRFLTWIYGWMTEHPDANYIPSAWGPPGWTQGTPLPADSYLDPHGTNVEPHDLALVLKGGLYCALAGADETTCKYVIARCVRALALAQVQTPSDPVRGAFTHNPAGFEVYSFHQGEILDALALASLHPELVPASVISPGTGLTPVLQVSETNLEFDETALGATRLLSVTLTNVGGSDLIVLSTAINGGQFSVDSGMPTLLEIGDSAVVKLKYAPTEVGDASGSFSIYSNDPRGPHVVQLKGSGKGLAPAHVTLSRESVSFPDTMAGSTSRQTFTVTNTGAAVLNITSVTITGAKYALVGDAPTSISAGQAVTLTIDFAPTASGVVTGGVTIESNADNSPSTVQFTGKGTPQTVSSITWLTTDGAKLRDASGTQVLLRSVNWYGLEQAFIPGGLWSRGYKTVVANGVTEEGVLDQAKRLGFNSVRILVNQDITWPGTNVNTPRGLQEVYTNPFLNPDLFNNPDNKPLYELTASPQPVIDGILILDKIVDYCATIGLRVILDMHVLAPDNDNISGTNGKWYTTTTPDAVGGTSHMKGTKRNEQQAIDAWVFLANRYKNQPVVCGADLINEPWQCTWDDDPLTGLPAYYERVGAAIQAVNPNILIICEGNSGNVDHTPTAAIGSPESAQGFYNWGTLWGGKLDGARNRPVVLPVPNKLVYSPHEYGSHLGTTELAHQWFHPEEVVPNYKGDLFPNNMFEVWRRQWGFLAEENIAPLWIGEYGATLVPGGINWGTTEHPLWFGTEYTQRNYDLDAQWLQKLQEYCNTHDINHAWWAFNPGTEGGIVQGDDWKTTLEVKYRHLRDRFIFPNGPRWAPAAPNTTPVDNPVDDADYLVDDDAAYLVDDDTTQLIDG